MTGQVVKILLWTGMGGRLGGTCPPNPLPAPKWNERHLTLVRQCYDTVECAQWQPVVGVYRQTPLGGTISYHLLGRIVVRTLDLRLLVRFPAMTLSVYF